MKRIFSDSRPFHSTLATYIRWNKLRQQIRIVINGFRMPADRLILEKVKINVQYLANIRSKIEVHTGRKMARDINLIIHWISQLEVALNVNQNLRLQVSSKSLLKIAEADS